MLSFPRINLPIVTSNVITGFRARDHEWAYLRALSVVPVTFTVWHSLFPTGCTSKLFHGSPGNCFGEGSRRSTKQRKLAVLVNTDVVARC